MTLIAASPVRRVFPAESRSLRSLAEFVRRAAAEWNGGQERTRDLELCIDELATNIVRYGRSDQGPCEFAVSLEVLPGEVRVTLEDDGPAFDPSNAPTPELPNSLAEAQIGGRGIWIVRGLADELLYERVEGRNVVRLVLRSR